jgi:hypothetical protein
MIGWKIKCNVGVKGAQVVAEVVSEPIRVGSSVAKYMIMVFYGQKIMPFYFAYNANIAVIERK